MSDVKPSADFLKMFDALLVIESIDDAKELVQNPELIENLEFHEAPEDQADAGDSEEK